MWNSLRADFKEFVSAVADDTSNVLEKLDAGTAEITGDTNNDEAVDSKINDDNDDDKEEEEEEEEEDDYDSLELKEILQLLMDHPGTFTQEFTSEQQEDPDDVKQFLDSFSIDAKTDEIAHLLQTHQDTLQKQFEELCPTQVTYEDFWKRYFYRCDKQRILRQLKEESERARQARVQAIQGSINTVTNFFTGAVTTISKKLVEVEGDDEGAHKKTSPHNFFGTSTGRPPFVMNTAVSTDGEDNGDDDDQDEEELGWDDDDDDDDDINPSGGIDDNVEQITFTDKVSENLQEQLKQAIAERDLIQQTVHLQAEQIKDLQVQLSQGGCPKNNGDCGGDTILEQLKLKLFESEAELAALMAKIHDDHLDHCDTSGGDDPLAQLIRQIQALSKDDLSQLMAHVLGGDKAGNHDADVSAHLEQQVQTLTETVEAKDADLAKLQGALRIANQELELSRAQFGNGDQASAQRIQDLESQLQTSESKLEAATAENEGLQLAVKAAQAHATSQVSIWQKEVSELKNQAVSLTAELTSTQQRLEQAMIRADEADAKLQPARDVWKVQDAERAQTSIAPSAPLASPSSPGSISTGEKVESPAKSILSSTKVMGDAGDEDDWGEDWD